MEEEHTAIAVCTYVYNMQITGKYDMNPHKAHLNYNESWKEKKNLRTRYI
jgi:hypothetical protein